MSLFDKVKCYFYKINENKRYKKIKSCNLPFPFFNKKGPLIEWVQYVNGHNCYNVEQNIVYAVGDIARVGVTYHYKALLLNSSQSVNYCMKVSHCHSFDEVVQALYDYPETFSIPDEFLNEYSKQELDYLKIVKNYLQLIDLKDVKMSEERRLLDEKWSSIYNKKHKSIKDRLFVINYQKRWRKLVFKENLERYTNENAKKYSSCRFMDIADENIVKALINGEKNYKIDVKYSFIKPYLNQKYLISYDGNFLGVVEIVEEKIIKFKDLSKDMVNIKLAGFKSFKEYKNNMKKDFIEEGKIYNEEFTDESLICYETLKVIEKF